MMFALTEVPELQPKHRSAIHQLFERSGLKRNRIKKEIKIDSPYGSTSHKRVQNINHYDAQMAIKVLESLETKRELLLFAKPRILEYLKCQL